MDTGREQARAGVTLKDPHYVQRVQESFARQRAMSTLGISLARIEPGLVELAMPYNDLLTQQNGYLHAGVITAALDSACGYAAFSLMSASADVLTVEFKTNLLAPAEGCHFNFCGEVIKAGRTLTVCEARAFAIGPLGKKLIAIMTSTLIALERHSATS